MIPCSYRASACNAVLPSCMAFYVISVRQTRDLPVVSLFPHPASFRFHLTMDTLAFGYILPTTGRIRDLHPLETCAAGRTLKKPPGVRRRRKAKGLLSVNQELVLYVWHLYKYNIYQCYFQYFIKSTPFYTTPGNDTLFNSSTSISGLLWL